MCALRHTQIFGLIQPDMPHLRVNMINIEPFLSGFNSIYRVTVLYTTFEYMLHSLILLRTSVGGHDQHGLWVISKCGVAGVRFSKGLGQSHGQYLTSLPIQVLGRGGDAYPGICSVVYGQRGGL